MRNERTGKDAATIAGTLLEIMKRDGYVNQEWLYRTNDAPVITVKQLKTLCASALTQSPDKPKKAVKK